MDGLPQPMRFCRQACGLHAAFSAVDLLCFLDADLWFPEFGDNTL
jgi:hypothetical protein